MQTYTTGKAALREFCAWMSILPERLLYSQATRHIQTAESDVFEGSGPGNPFGVTLLYVLIWTVLPSFAELYSFGTDHWFHTTKETLLESSDVSLSLKLGIFQQN